MDKMDLVTTETAASVSGSSPWDAKPLPHPARAPVGLERHLAHAASRQWNNHWLVALHTLCSPPISHHSVSLMKYPG